MDGAGRVKGQEVSLWEFGVDPKHFYHVVPHTMRRGQEGSPLIHHFFVIFLVLFFLLFFRQFFFPFFSPTTFTCKFSICLLRSPPPTSHTSSSQLSPPLPLPSFSNFFYLLLSLFSISLSHFLFILYSSFFLLAGGFIIRIFSTAPIVVELVANLFHVIKTGDWKRTSEVNLISSHLSFPLHFLSYHRRHRLSILFSSPDFAFEFSL